MVCVIRAEARARASFDELRLRVDEAGGAKALHLDNSNCAEI